MVLIGATGGVVGVATAGIVGATLAGAGLGTTFSSTLAVGGVQGLTTGIAVRSNTELLNSAFVQFEGKSNKISIEDSMSRVFNPTNMTTDAIAGGVAEGLLYMANSAATKNQAQPCAEGEISKNAKFVKNLDESGDRYRDLRIKYHADPDSKHIIGQLDEIDLNDLDTEVNRPSWSDSESTGKVIFSEYKSQQSFRDGSSEQYGVKGSVRPDEYSETYKNSIDVKNYNLMSNDVRVETLG